MVVLGVCYEPGGVTPGETRDKRQMGCSQAAESRGHVSQLCTRNGLKVNFLGAS